MQNENKILELLGQISGRLEALETEQRGMKSEMNQRFDAVDERFAGMDQRFDAVDERFDSLEYSLNKAWEDIGLAEKRTQRHELEFHGVKPQIPAR